MFEYFCHFLSPLPVEIMHTFEANDLILAYSHMQIKVRLLMLWTSGYELVGWLSPKLLQSLGLSSY